MTLLQGLALGILLYCHYFIWQHTKDWGEFLFYVFIMNVVGASFGIPIGMWVGSTIRQARWERRRREQLKELYSRGESPNSKDN